MLNVRHCIIRVNTMKHVNCIDINCCHNLYKEKFTRFFFFFLTLNERLQRLRNDTILCSQNCKLIRNQSFPRINILNDSSYFQKNCLNPKLYLLEFPWKIVTQ